MAAVFAALSLALVVLLVAPLAAHLPIAALVGTAAAGLAVPATMPAMTIFFRNSNGRK